MAAIVGQGSVLGAEGYQIYILKKDNYGQTEIADLLGRNKSTISRELSRNRGLKGYRPKQAHNLAIARQLNEVQRRLGWDVWRQVEALVRQEWGFLAIVECRWQPGGLV